MTAATKVTIVSAEPAQADTLGHLIAVAFADLDISRWLVADRIERVRALGGQFAMLVRHATTHGIVHTTADRSAVAVWLPALPDRPQPDVPDYHLRLAAICGPDLDRFLALDQVMDAHHPHEPHWYLAFLAVHPALQNRGIGSMLLRHQHQQLDADGIPAFLHAGDPRARDLYLRHGYLLQPDAPFRVLDSGPQMWPMMRPPTTELDQLRRTS